MCQGSLNGISRVFQGIFQEVSTFKSVSKTFKGVSQKSQGYLKEDWRVFWGRFQWGLRYFERTWKGIRRVSNVFQECFKEISRVFKESFKDASRKNEGYFNGVLSGLQGYLKIVEWVFEEFF